MSFVKHDKDKPRFDLIDETFLLRLAEVLTQPISSGKYEPENWKKAEYEEARRRYYSAMQRHANAYARGEHYDDDSGLPHLAHVAVNAMFLEWFERREFKAAEEHLLEWQDSREEDPNNPFEYEQDAGGNWVKVDRP